MPHPLGLGHFTFLDLAPLELIQLAGKTGFDFVGLRLHPIAPGELHYHLPVGSSALRDVTTAMSALGIGVYDIETVVLHGRFQPQTLVPVLEQSAALGAKRLNVCGDDPDANRLQDTFNAICALSRPFGIGVDIECMKWRVTDTVEKCAAIVVAARDETAGILIDTLHLSRCGANAATLKALDPNMIKSCQLCDAPANAPKTTQAIIAEARSARLPPGDGGLDLTRVVAALPPNAVFSVELPMTNDLSITGRAKMIYDKTQTLLKNVRPEQSM